MGEYGHVPLHLSVEFFESIKATLPFWDNSEGSPMLELWTARTSNLGEPQAPD